MSGFKLNAIEN